MIPNKVVIIKIKLRNLLQQIRTHADEIDRRNRRDIGTVLALIEVRIIKHRIWFQKKEPIYFMLVKMNDSLH